MRVSTEYQKGLVCAIASIVLVSIAQLAMKYGMAHVAIESFRTVHSLSDLFGTLSNLSLSTALLPIGAGIFCYGVSMLCWMAALGRLPLNLAYPLLSLSYPLVYLGAALLPFFQETLITQRIAGIGFIMLGITLLMLKTTEENNRQSL
jgi:undecaprenyl phosphate-alpha-L-ara4N flippase subunit ArnF